MSQRRNRQRIEAMFSRYGPAIYSRCRRMLRSAVEAEDATQEVFLRVLRHIDAAPDDDTALAWVYRISTNYCLNRLRDDQRRADTLDDMPVPQCHSVEGIVLSRDFAQRLMGEAPAELRTPAVLFHLKGMRQEQIAKTLGVSRRTVLYRLGAFADHARRLLGEADLEVA